MTYAWSQTSPEELLSKRFHLQQFHEGQREIIEHLVQGKRVLAIQRTGWGKSLCYQMASLYIPGLTIVISPLKALMRDQCQRCNEVYQIPAAIVSSDLPDIENRTILKMARDGELKILYIAPERFNNRAWQEHVPHMHIGMVVVDEAHCVSVWGHDFRPDYRRIKRLLAILPKNLPVLALTATANRRVEQDILQQIGVDALMVRGGMQRPNLHATVVHVNNEQEKLTYIVTKLPSWRGSGIIYTATKPDAMKIAKFLQQQLIDAEYYHAERPHSIRQKLERGLMANEYKVVCSTNALGMGIDKPDIRFVIHYHCPASPIHYYQEIGRAGRDGKIAQCILLYDPADLRIQRHFIQQDKPTKAAYEKILSLIQSSSQGISEQNLLRATGFSEHKTKGILVDLEEQSAIRRVHMGYGNYVYVPEFSIRVDLSVYDDARREKEKELVDMQRYAHLKSCYVGYLTEYLGDPAGYQCGTCSNCRPENFIFAEDKQKVAAQFLEQKFLPPLEKHGNIEAGYALDYYYRSVDGFLVNSETARLVNASKYKNAGPFADELVLQAEEVIRTRYPLDFDGIVSVPSTRSGNLVEDFARRVARRLRIPYISGLVKTRHTQEQKSFSNRIQKRENVQGAFSVQEHSLVNDKVLLLIDDIYDSGYTLREVAATLCRAGAKAVYPLTITKTLHSDDQ